MVINRLALRIFNFYLVNKIILFFGKIHLLFSDANINAQQTAAAAAAANHRLLFSTNNTPDLSAPSDNLFRSGCDNPSNNILKISLNFYLSFILDDLLYDNTNMSTVSLSSMIFNRTLIFILIYFL
jgi:hypothetical protein